MGEMHKKLFSLPGVVGYGYGKKAINGLLTETSALIVFVEKKIPHLELEKDKIIPSSINETPTDVIEIGEIHAFNQAEKKTVDSRECELLYRLLLNCLSRGGVKPESLGTLQELAGFLKEDIDKIIMLKRILSGINPKSYKKLSNTAAPFHELVSYFSKDLNRVTLLFNVLSDLNIGLYKNATKSLGTALGDFGISEKIQAKAGIINRVIRMMNKVDNSSRTSLVRPANPGVSIGHYKGARGTFGAVVYDKKTHNPLILSNNHVLANTSLADKPKAKVNDLIVQPAKTDGKNRALGRLEKYAALNSYPKANIVDCAVARPIIGDNIEPEILEIGRINGTTKAKIGMKIRKSGRTTGLTTGEIKAVGATIKVNYGDGLFLKFVDQIVASPMSEPGDSGALVVDRNNKAVGLLFAGSNKSTIINPIQPVLDYLGITV